MKSKFFLLPLLVVLLFSCQKEEQPITSSATFNGVNITKSSSLRVWYDNGNPDGVDGVDYGCKGSGGNCGPTNPLVTSSDKDMIRDILQTVDNGNPGQIQSVFSTYETRLRSIIDSDHLRDLISGDLSATTRSSSTDDPYILVNNSNGIVGVYPFSI